MIVVVGTGIAACGHDENATRCLEVEEWSEPLDTPTGRRQCVIRGRVLVAREVTDGSPDTHVLYVPAELFKAEGAIGPSEDVDATISFERLVAREHRPGRIKPR